MTDEVDQRRSTSAQRMSIGGVAWLVALATSGVLVGLSELGRRHYAAHTTAARILGAILLWLIAASVLRLVIHVGALVSGRTSGRPQPAAVQPRRRRKHRRGRNDSRRRWPAPTQRAQGWTVRYAVVAVVVSWLLIFTVGLSLWALHVRVPRGARGLITEAILLGTLIPLYRSERLRPVDVGLRRVPGAPAVGLAFLSLIAVSFLQSLWTRGAKVPRTHSTLSGISHKPTLVIVLAGLTAVVAAPVVEEVFFRGVLYRSFRNRLPVFPAALIASVIFAIGHTQYPLIERPNQAIFGVAMCLLYEYTGSLLPGIALHSFIDGSSFEAALSGRALVVPAFFVLLALALLFAPLARTLRQRFTGGGRVALE